jgi:hypothetical protein
MVSGTELLLDNEQLRGGQLSKCPDMLLFNIQGATAHPPLHQIETNVASSSSSGYNVYIRGLTPLASTPQHLIQGESRVCAQVSFECRFRSQARVYTFAVCALLMTYFLCPINDVLFVPYNWCELVPK